MKTTVLGLLVVMSCTLCAARSRALSANECTPETYASLVSAYEHQLSAYDGQHLVDLYLPRTARSAPLVVYIHGGGWRRGDYTLSCETGLWAVNLLQAGFAVASVEYTLAPDAPATTSGTAESVLQQVREVKQAIQWLRARSTQFGIDPQQVVVSGGSAGGNLAALVGLTGGEPEYGPDERVQFVFAYAGIYDISVYSDGWALQAPLDDWSGNGPGLMPLVFGCYPTNIYSWRPCGSDVIRAASPLDHIDPSDPRVLLMHGDRDPIVPPSQMRSFADGLCAADKLAGAVLAQSDDQTNTVYAHNLEPFLADNPFLGALLQEGISGQLVASCPQ
jgi:acetyl esterase/lipase